MRIDLTCDIPKEYNDLSRSEIAGLSVQFKRLVDDLNFYLNRIDKDNLSDEFVSQLENIENLNNGLDDIKIKLAEIQTKIPQKFHTTFSAKNSGIIQNELIKSDSIVQIIPDEDSARSFAVRSAYIDEINDGNLTIAFVTSSTANLTYNVTVILY